MKLFSKFFGPFILVALITTVSIISCSKKNDASVAGESKEQQQKAKLSNLVTKMYAEGKESEYADIREEYVALSSEEYKLFQEIRLETEKAMMKKSVDASGKALNLSTEEISSEINQIREVRNSVDNISISKYGKSSNKLSAEQVKEAIKMISENSLKGSRISGTSEASATLACPLYLYPSTACKNDNYYRRHYGYWRVINAVGESPCDYEFRFNGSFNKINGGNFASRDLLRHYGCVGSRLITYLDGLDTGTIFGYYAFTFYIGSPSYAVFYMNFQL